MKKCYLLFALTFLLPVFSFSQILQSLGKGVQLAGEVYTMEYDSVNNLTYIGGYFQSVNGVTANNIAVWDGTTWRELGGGLTGTVTLIKLINNNLYVSGVFQQAGNTAVNNIAMWDGINWHAMGAGFNPEGPTSLQYFEGKIYAAGNISTSDTAVLNGIAVWNGNAWAGVGKGFDIAPSGMLTFQNKLYVFGSFSETDNLAIWGIAKYDGTNWSPVDTTDKYYSVNSLCSINDSLFATEVFSDTIFTLHGNKWEPYFISSVYPDQVFSYQSQLYAIIDSSLGSPSFKVSIVNLNPGTSGETIGYCNLSEVFGISSVFSIRNTLYIMGHFAEVNDRINITDAQYTNGVWTNFASVIGGAYLDAFEGSMVNSMLIDSLSGNLIIAGYFYFAGDSISPMVAQWNGTNWKSMGAGFNHEVKKIIRYKNDIYACGSFSVSGNSPLNGIAKWNGSTWVKVDTLNPVTVVDMVVYNNELYVVASYPSQFFYNYFILKYDGSAWSLVNSQSDINQWIGALGVFNGKIIAGGGDFDFNSSSYSTAFLDNNNQWQPMGSLFLDDPQITSFVTIRDTLYLCGEGIYTWDGSDWRLFMNDCDASGCYSSPLIFSLQNRLVYTFNNDGLHINYTNSSKIINGLFLYCYSSIDSSSEYVGGFFPWISPDGINQVYYNCIGKIIYSKPLSTIKASESSLCDHEYVTFSAEGNDIFNSYQWILNGATPPFSTSPSTIVQYQKPGNFVVKLIFTNLEGTDSITMNPELAVYDCTDGVKNQMIDDSVSLYPNPASAVIRLNMPGVKNTSEIKIINLFGVVVSDSKIVNASEISIDISNLPPSCYLLSIKTDEGEFQKRFIKCQ